MSNFRKEYLVVYDISDTKIRNQLFEKLKDHGLYPIQKSVFWGGLNKAERRSIERAVKELLEDGVGKIIIIQVEILEKNEAFFIGHTENEFSVKQFGIV